MAIKKGLGKGIDSLFDQNISSASKNSNQKKSDKANSKAKEKAKETAEETAEETTKETVKEKTNEATNITTGQTTKKTSEDATEKETDKTTDKNSSKTSLSRKTAQKKTLTESLNAEKKESKTRSATAGKKNSDKENIETGVIMLRIGEVEPNRDQPRKVFNEDKLHELADSITQHGIIEPLIVVKRDDYYEIVAGERRWRASMMAGLTEVPVVIKDYTKQQVVEVALIENLQREDLNPIEEAKAYQQLIEEYNLKQDEVADKVSKSRTTITNSIRLLKLDDTVQDMLVAECITSGHARALLALDDKSLQYEIANKILDEKLSVRETEKLIKQVKNGTYGKKTVKKKVFDNQEIYTSYEEKMKQSVGSKVTINRKDNSKGKIEIEYYSNDELDRIVSYLTK
jgi:parB-like partition proteins